MPEFKGGRLVEIEPAADTYSVPRMFAEIPPPAPRISKDGNIVTYRHPLAYDQIGPRCVSYTFRAKLDGEPFRTARGPGPFEIYDIAQDNDEWPGRNYDGTSARGACIGLRARGIFSSYWWPKNIQECVAAMFAGYGPIPFGAWWWSSMQEPRRLNSRQYLMEIHRDAYKLGGHEFLLFGINRNRGLGAILNSHGLEYGYRGVALAPLELLDKLLYDEGDAVVAIETRSSTWSS